MMRFLNSSSPVNTSWISAARIARSSSCSSSSDAVELESGFDCSAAADIEHMRSGARRALLRAPSLLELQKREHAKVDERGRAVERSGVTQRKAGDIVERAFVQAWSRILFTLIGLLFELEPRKKLTISAPMFSPNSMQASKKRKPRHKLPSYDIIAICCHKMREITAQKFI